MASSSSSFLLVAVVLALLLAVGSCGTPLILTIGAETTSTKICLEPNVAIHELSIKPKGATDFSEDLKEVAPQTFVLDGKKLIEGPISVRWAAKAGGYRVKDDIIPAGFKPGEEYNTGELI